MEKRFQIIEKSIIIKSSRSITEEIQEQGHMSSRKTNNSMLTAPIFHIDSNADKLEFPKRDFEANVLHRSMLAFNVPSYEPTSDHKMLSSKDNTINYLKTNKLQMKLKQAINSNYD